MLSLDTQKMQQYGRIFTSLCLDRPPYKHFLAPFSILLLCVRLCRYNIEIFRLQKLQNRAARIVANSSFDTPSSQLNEILRWKTVNEIIDTESIVLVFKSLNELVPPYSLGLFWRNSQGSLSRIGYAVLSGVK